MFAEAVCQSPPCFAYVDFLALGPEILTVLEIKGQVLHRVHLHVKVPGWLLNLNALLTRKLPKFLWRLNEMSGGRKYVCSLQRILKFLRITFLVGKCEWNSVGFFVPCSVIF